MHQNRFAEVHRCAAVLVCWCDIGGFHTDASTEALYGVGDRGCNNRITCFEMPDFRLRKPDRGFRLNNTRSVPVPNFDC